jgi:putative FmdB family regulatory protein
LPLYEYRCAKGHRFEKIEPITAKPVQKCPKCGARAERLLGAPALQFKGSGWYVTDYAGKTAEISPGDSAGDGPSADSSAGKAADKTSEKSAKAPEKPAATKGADKGSEKRKR